ncbi:sugar-binding transcriptional regulator [Notoacmeibacter ruber]|nr:sugar-binding domain-containing protein [Notoacmeibacter ruber]
MTDRERHGSIASPEFEPYETIVIYKVSSTFPTDKGIERLSAERHFMSRITETQDQVRDVAWMHYVAGLTQAEIAKRRGLSRMKVHRLVQAALDQGIVRIFVNQVSSDCVELETKLMKRYGLSSCIVAPDTGLTHSMAGTMPVVASAGAFYLYGRLENTEPKIIGIGSGRTMAEVVRQLPSIRRPKVEFISTTGDFAALSAANPFEVINILMEKTGGGGYAFTAPLIVDTPEDRELFLRQRSVCKSREKLAEADFIFAGIGHIGPGSFFSSFGLLTEAEMAELNGQGAVADLVGNPIDEEGRFVENGIASRMLGLQRSVLRESETIVICSGTEKWRAARSALRSGCLNGFITSQSLAKRLLAEPA